MGALEGVRVVEIAEGVAAPLVATLLADHGADVVKVERPQGDFTRSDPGFAAWNRGKKSVVVDPSSADDLAWLAAQLSGADICLLGAGESFADWSAEVADAASANRGLIVARFPAYLEEGTPWAGGRESHGLLAAYAGLGWRQSSNDGGPVDPISKFVSYSHALWGAACTLAALYQRGPNGWGQEVTVTGMNAMMQSLIHPYSVDPHAPDPATDIGSFGRHPTYRPYQAKDGKWIGSGALGDKFEVMLLNLLGIPDVLEDPRIGGVVDRMKHPLHVDWVMARVAEAFAKRPRREWIEMLMAAGIPCGEVNPREELLDHPQVAAIGMRVELDDPERGQVTMPGVPTNLSRSPGRVTGPAPRLGGDQGLAAWPPRPAPTAPPRYAVGPLDGIRALNLGTFVATPYAGMLLSELGAEVVKVEPPTGDPFRNNGYPHNRGMRSLAIDLADPVGREALKRIVRSADIVIDGMRPGVMKRMKLDHGSLADEKPEIITMSLSGFGEIGPLANLPGFDMVVQGFAGIMMAQGDANEPVAQTVAYVDVTTACMNVFGCLLALVDRQRSGEGQHVWNSLIGTAAYLQTAELVRYQERPAPRQGHPDFRGSEWHDRYYRTVDGWVRIDACGDITGVLAALRGLGLVSRDAETEQIEAAIQAGIAGLTAAAAAALLNGAGVPSVPARKVSQLFADAQLMASEFAHFSQSVEGYLMSMPGRYATFSRTQRWGPMKPPGIGEHSRAVLDAAGFAFDEIDTLIDASIVREGGAMPTRFGATYR